MSEADDKEFMIKEFRKGINILKRKAIKKYGVRAAKWFEKGM